MKRIQFSILNSQFSIPYPQFSILNSQFSILKVLLFLFSWFFFSSASAFEITVHSNDFTFDSLAVQQFLPENKWEVVSKVPFSTKTVMKDKRTLSPGMYIVTGDDTPLLYILMSDTKNQKFDIRIEKDNIIFNNSPENSANISYLKEMEEFEMRMKSMEKEFQALSGKGLPQHVVQNVADSLVKEVEKIDREKLAAQYRVIKEHPGTLLASIVTSSINMQNPPREYFSNKRLMEQYYADHFFDHFPWSDERLMRTPVAYNKFRLFAHSLSGMSPEVATPFLLKTLDTIALNNNSYFILFDNLQNSIGSQSSPYWREYLYISMLKHALALPNLPAERKLRYEKDLKRLDRNHEGMQVPDFKILLSNGDTTSLYAIDSGYMILYLQNPDCPTCKEIREKLDQLPLLNKAIDENKITILTVYFEQNEELWRTYLAHSANSKYLHGWDYQLNIEENILFDTHIIPYMFLLDKDKKVIKKDIYLEEIESYIKQLNL